MRIASILAGLFMVGLLSMGAAQEGSQATKAPDVNDEAPDFELRDSKGQTYRLSDFRGKNVILEFIRSGSW
jgi:cytochrome oxidase Cu insertion factor (SCO1/SenC/PrrC family)